MAKKKKHEEHENLERWLVSYADFMTLLFATFVVLYALAQTNINEFTKLQDAIKSAFKSFSFLQGEQSILKDSGKNVIDSSGANDALIDSLFMEYISPKYEEQSFEQIQEEIKKLRNEGLNNVTTKIDNRGLVITLNDSNILFEPASATLSKDAMKKLDYIAALIGKKFMLHLIRIEGHTDSEPINSPQYPSNWELSTARACTIVRYMIDKFKFIPDLFTAYNSVKMYGANRRYDTYYKDHSTGDYQKASACIECGQCEGVCPQHLEIISLLKEVAEVFDK